MLGPLPPNINSVGVNPVALATVLFIHDYMGNKLCPFPVVVATLYLKKLRDFLHAPLTGVLRRMPYLTWTLRDSKFRFQEGEWNCVPFSERITSGFMVN